MSTGSFLRPQTRAVLASIPAREHVTAGVIREAVMRSGTCPGIALEDVRHELRVLEAHGFVAVEHRDGMPRARLTNALNRLVVTV